MKADPAAALALILDLYGQLRALTDENEALRAHLEQQAQAQE